MPTFCPPKSDVHPRRIFVRSSLRLRAAVVLGLLFGHPFAQSQTLAQKNWAGSGVSVETWWHRAVFYRIDPARFQAGDAFDATTATSSSAVTTGDLAGLAHRLDYIQSLGVDAILLAPAAGDPPLTPNAAGWDDLARAAVDHHLRLLVTLPAPESQAAASDAKVMALARAWLNQGVAGLYVPLRAIAEVDGAEHIAALLRQLHALVASVPGDRILLSEDPPTNAEPPVTRALAQTIQLTASAPFSAAQTPAAAPLRAQLSAALNAPAPLLLAGRVTAQPDAQQQTALDSSMAALLLASRAAVVIDAGQELGLLGTPGAKTAPLMQWTPSNRTQPPPPPPAPEPAKPTTAEVDAPFKPYVPPLPRDLFRPPPMPVVVPVEHPVNERTAPDSLPGFTAGALPGAAAVNGATANVALEDTDTDSLLNLYRHLIQLHHDNAALRNGTQTLLDRDADDALLWLRQAPASARTTGGVLVACNLSAKPLTLDLSAFHLRAAPLRTLLGATPVQSRTTMTVPPYAIFLGETSH